MDVFERTIRIDAPAEQVFDWHARPGAFERLTPPWEHVRVIERTGGIDTGRIVIEARIGPARVKWVAQHKDYLPGVRFRDVQESGPFAHWVHTHDVEPISADACLLRDHIEYALPLGALGRALGGGMVRRKLDRLFAYRHRVTAADIASHRRAMAAVQRNAQTGETPARWPLRIAVTGSSGVIGRQLCAFLTTGGHEVVRVVRKAGGGEGTIVWDPEAWTLEAGALEGFDAIVHLAGDGISQGRWTAAKKQRLYDSRANGTTLLSRAIASLRRKPAVLVSASGIGVYGDRGAEPLDEDSPRGEPGDTSHRFLAKTCAAWEGATAAAADAGVRVVQLRIGITLSLAGGALAKMLPTFSLGIGGVMGNGSQYWSWLALDDAIDAIQHCILTPKLRGPVNAVTPEAVTNREFTRTLGRVLRRPTIIPAPAFAMRLALGEIVDAAPLASMRVTPRRLIDTGFVFRYPSLEPALRHLLGR